MTDNTVTCPICNKAEGQLWGVEYKGHRIVKCPTCGLRFADPQIIRAEEVYQDEYFADKAERMFDPERLLLVLKSDLDSFHNIARVMGKNLTAESSVLDIGTGRGSFLIALKLLGLHNILGTDITTSNVDYLKSFAIEVKLGELKDLNLGRYDIITFHHVLEHLNNPGTFLTQVKSLLNDNGVGHLLIPNEGSLNSRFKSFLSKHKLKKRAFKHLAPGHHLWFYEQSTIVRLLEKYGFKIDYLGTRATEKKRGIASRMVHHLEDKLLINSWLEVVFSKK